MRRCSSTRKAAGCSACGPPLAPNYPAGAALGALYRHDHDAGLRAAWLMARLHAFDLPRFGITADCLPVLDVPIEGASDVIGSARLWQGSAQRSPRSAAPRPKA